jgi:Protein of unknown function (DUF2841)
LTDIQAIKKVLRNECDVHIRAFGLFYLDEHSQPQTLSYGLDEIAQAKLFSNNTLREIAIDYENQGRMIISESGEIQKVLDMTNDIDNQLDAEYDDDQVNLSNSSGSFDRNLSQHPSTQSSGYLQQRDHDSFHSLKRRRSTVNSYPNTAGYDSSASSEGRQVMLPPSDEPQFRCLCLGDKDQVDAWFQTRFKQLQQLHCKVVAKAWMKVIEPKKQTNYPYNKGMEAKPPWWPDIRHKEPDHISKTGEEFCYSL